jgi:tyrosyl-tRNA synthetase
VHGEAEVAKCEEASAALFDAEIASLSEEMLLAVTEDAPSTEISRQSIIQGLSLVEALERSGLAKSKNEARRTIDGGGIYINNLRQSDAGRQLGPDDLLHGRYIVVRKGPRGVHVLRMATV